MGTDKGTGTGTGKGTRPVTGTDMDMVAGVISTGINMASRNRYRQNHRCRHGHDYVN